MSFVAAFSITPTASASTFILEDTSVGSDMNLTGRTVYLIETNGQYLVFPIPWAIGQSTITINVLTQDISLNVRVLWNSSSPLAPPSTYIYEQVFAFTQYGEDFLYSLTQQQTANPTIVQDTNYYSNKGIVRTEIDSAINAIEIGKDQFSAQNCIARYNAMINNENYLF